MLGHEIGFQELKGLGLGPFRRVVNSERFWQVMVVMAVRELESKRRRWIGF